MAEEKPDNNATPPLGSEEKIKSAVSFLTHPSIINKEMVDKINFLKHKGMTQEEIDEALRRLGQSSLAVSSQRSLPAHPHPSRAAQEYALIRHKPWWTDVATLSLIAGLLGGLATVVLKLLVPWLHERQRRQEEHMRRLEEIAEKSQTKVAESVEAIRGMVGEMKQAIRETQTDQKRIRESLDAVAQKDSEIERLKTELSLLRSTTAPATPSAPQKPSSDVGGSRDRYQPGRTFDRSQLSNKTFVEGANSWDSNMSVGSSVYAYDSLKEGAKIPEWQLQSSAAVIVTDPDDTTQAGKLEEVSQLPADPLIGRSDATLSLAETISMVQITGTAPGIQQVNDTPLGEPVEKSDPSPLKPWQRTTIASTTPEHVES